MNIVVQEDIEDRFRLTVANTKGFRKGNMSIALQEAMELWIKDVNQRMENNLVSTVSQKPVQQDMK